MKIYCRQEDLNFGIQVAGKAISSKVIEPIYNNILLETTEDKLKIQGTSGDISIEIIINVELMEKHGGIAVPSREVTNLVSTFEPGKIELESDDCKILTIATKKYNYNLNGFSAEQFPSLPKIISENYIEMSQEDLKNAIKETSFAIAPPEEVRSVLKGSLFEIHGNNINIVSADGRRMAKKTSKITNESEKDYEVIVPKKTLNELVKILKDEKDAQVRIYISDSQIDFYMDNIRILSGLIQGKFPNYRQVIPAHCEQSLRINKDIFYRALKRASFVAQDMESPNLIKFKIHGSQLILTANTQDLGQAYEEIDLEEPGQSIDISFNSKYLLDALTAIPAKEILLEITNSGNPGIIKPSNEDDYLYVIMPIRLK